MVGGLGCKCVQQLMTKSVCINSNYIFLYGDEPIYMCLCVPICACVCVPVYVCLCICACVCVCVSECVGLGTAGWIRSLSPESMST